jgi:sulfonate transport system substrate-binding protein
MTMSPASPLPPPPLHPAQADRTHQALIMHRRTLLLAAGLTATALPARRSRAAERLRLGDQRGGFKSLMEAAGVADDTLEWSLFAAAAPLVEALNAGAIDVGGVGDAPFAFARAAGVPVRAIAATRSSGQSTAIIVPRASPITNFADLKGKRVGTGKGSVGHFLTIAARDWAGMRPADITLVFLSPPDAKAALASGAIDAWATWSQYVYLAVEQEGARIVLDGRGIMSGLSYELARDDAIIGKAELITNFVTRLTKALRWGAANVDAYAETWARETRVPVGVARATLIARGYVPSPIDQSVITDQQRTIDLYVREHLLPGPLDAAAGFDTAFNQAAH